MASFRAKYPGKAIWTTYFLVSAPIRLVFIALYHLPPSLRQHPKWTWHQAVGNAALRMWFVFASTIEIVPPKSLEPGSDKDSWAIIEPAAPEFYCDVLDDTEIRPTKIGGMWYTTPYSKETHQDKPVVLHFHGGAYVLGGCRPSDAASWGPTNLSKQLDALVFCPQYRLASHPKGRFPAAFQDAVTSYMYLLDLGIPASSIIFSGDSAGGNLALALLRYVTSNDILPSPGAVLLWSPWLDLSADWDTFATERLGKTDYIPPILGHWALRVFKPESIDVNNPYISPLKSPFSVKAPIFIQSGSGEVLCADSRAFKDAMKQISGNIVEMVELDNAPRKSLHVPELSLACIPRPNITCPLFLLTFSQYV
ncbi:hypothetical protein NHQ30_005034 [Ciborinia camelliae]|nr:hypothetical protein NHQ30_005034 [Ciborinia camelliae]